MRFTNSITAALLGLALTSGAASALASPPPSLVTHVGRFQASSLAAGKAPASAASLQAAARSIAVEKSGRPGLSLETSRVVALSSGERIVKMHQTHKGLRVMGGGATVRFGVDNVAQMVALKAVDDLPEDVTPTIDAAAAIKTAAKASGLAVDPERVHLAIWLVAGSPTLAWAASPTAIPGLPYAPVVIIDAHTGEILLRYNSIVTLNQANVYATNPTKSPNIMQVTLPVGAGETTLKNELVESTNCVDKKTTKTVDFGFPITVHVCELEHSEVADANGDFMLPFPGDTVAEDPFSQVQMFYHVNRAYDFIKTFIPNFDVNPGTAAPMTTISNLRTPDLGDLANIGNVNKPLVPFQNAFFSPPGDALFGPIFGLSGTAMYFGQGPNRDYSYDGDVIYHEFGHGVVFGTLNLVQTAHLDKYGASHSNGGMNEGLADYFSAALGGDPDVGEYASKDIDASWTAIRSLTNPDKIPTAIGGEVHQDATLFSGALWDVRAALSKTDANNFDAAIIAGMESAPAPADVGYDELADIFVKSVAASPLGKAGADKLTAAFTARGVLPDAKRVLEYTGTTLTGPKELGGGLWFGLGTQITGTKAYAPGIIQFHTALAERTTSITVTFEKVDLGGNPFGGQMTPFAPKLLVRFAPEPITFSTFKPPTPNDDVIEVDTKPAGNTYTFADIPAPEGATSVYVMIVNTGQSDGAYTNYGMTSVQAPPPMGTGGAGGEGGAGGAGGNDGAVVIDDGCGCAVPGSTDSSSSTLFVAAAGVAASLVRRRRARRAS